MKQDAPDFGRLSRLIGEKEEKFRAFFELLFSYNSRFNLTAITEKEEVFHKHFLDSLAAEEYLERGAKCVEVGSGAGFPSIPLMLAREDLSFTLIESTGKKCSFLQECVKEFSLPAEIVCMRAEDAGRGKYRERADVCVSRAVARMNTLAEYCLPLVKKGGTMIAYKGDADEEIKEAERAVRLLGGDKEECVRYSLPNGYGTRTLVFVKKIQATPPSYPRGQGAERRDPIV